MAATNQRPEKVRIPLEFVDRLATFIGTFPGITWAQANPWLQEMQHHVSAGVAEEQNANAPAAEVPATATT
jgi:hypothetical protein